MQHLAMQHILQAGLSTGFSAVTGIHSKDAPKPDPNFNGLALLEPPSYVPTALIRIVLKGANGRDVYVPPLYQGAQPQGDTATQYQDDARERPALIEGWKLAASKGLTFTDTAQAYGSGESERIITELTRGMPRDSFQVQTKWYDVPDQPSNFFASVPKKHLKGSLERLNVDYVDVYLVHGPGHPRSKATVAKGLKECVDEGWTRAVGVCNYNIEDMLEMQHELGKYGIPLALNQCEYNIVRRYPETHGLLQACKDHGIVFQSYASLAEGRLTGKYDAEHEPPKTYRFSQYPMKDLEPTLQVLKDIAKSRGVPPAAVALNYNMSKGAQPLVGVRSREQVEQNMKALGWRLTEDEVRRIDEVSLDGKSTVLWQRD